MKQIDRNIRTIDADGKSPGRLATEIATFLIGKYRPDFTPNMDQGDHVQVINASLMTFTGKKMDQKMYYHHTAYANGLRITPLKRLWAKDPGEVLRRAVSRMLPKNSHRDTRMTRLVVKN